MLISYDSKGACNLILSVSIEHCYIVQGQALTGGGLYIRHTTTTTGDEPYQCDTGEQQHTLNITDVHFANNTAHYGGGNINIFDNSSICNHINISNSCITWGLAQVGGGVHFEMGRALKIDHTARAGKDSERYNMRVIKLSEKQWTIWNCNIQNNFAAAYVSNSRV